MSATDQGRNAAVPNLVTFPPQFPNALRYQNAAFFRAALFGISRATFYNYLKAGRIPPPDAKFGPRNAWRETTIAKAVENFAVRVPDTRKG
jgi:predicted DNA-binding transcriptional regulator AlpA